MKADDWKRSIGPWIRGTLIGFPFGTIPGGRRRDPDLPLYADGEEARQAPEEFGKGAIEGVAGPEAANNASPRARWCRCSLGCPPRPTAAILLSAFQQYGLQPGPLLFESNSRWCGASSRASTSAT
jgi:putative tricarboxylic transport membrane protein